MSDPPEERGFSQDKKKETIRFALRFGIRLFEFSFLLATTSLIGKDTNHFNSTPVHHREVAKLEPVLKFLTCMSDDRNRLVDIVKM